MMKKLLLVMILLAGLVMIMPVSAKGFNEFGYNDQARIFVGTGSSWCQGKLAMSESECDSYMGNYAKDKLVMKWNAEWDRGNADRWLLGPYAAWENNEWNGRVPGGSGEVWHYKIIWVGSNCVDEPDGGGYCIWGQFRTIMDQGSSSDRVHTILAKSNPNGYGSYR
jgi:hypothetical protein